MLSGLELWGVGGQNEQMDVLGHTQVHAAGFPASAIEHEDDLLGGTGADLAGECFQLDLAERDADRGGQMKDRTPRRGMDEADQIAPLEAVLHRSARSLSIATPHLVQDRLESDAVLVDGPELGLGVGEGGRDRLDERTEFFLHAACCSASASTWRGRGLRRLPSSPTQ